MTRAHSLQKGLLHLAMQKAHHQNSRYGKSHRSDDGEGIKAGGEERMEHGSRKKPAFKHVQFETRCVQTMRPVVSRKKRVFPPSSDRAALCRPSRFTFFKGKRSSRSHSAKRPFSRAYQ